MRLIGMVVDMRMLARQVLHWLEKHNRFAARVKSNARCLAERLGLRTHNRLLRRRRRLAYRYLHGRGIEIGALHQPLPVRAGVIVEHIDRCTRQENIDRFPELDPKLIVEPDRIEDGFALESIPDGSMDFVVANHVLEHSSNTLQTLVTWSSKIAPGGVVFVTVPVLEHCFDRGRPLTGLEHFVEDYRLYRAGLWNELRHRNREHYREWVTISGPAASRERGTALHPGNPAEIEAQIDLLVEQEAEIHFHTFDADSVRSLMSFFTKEMDHRLRVTEIVNSTEVVAILRRES